MIRRPSAILGWPFFWILVLVLTTVSLGSLIYWLREIYQYNFFPFPPGPVTEHSGPHLIQLKDVLNEGISIAGVSASILIAGLGIATPLYLTAWTTMSDSVFRLIENINDHLPTSNIEDKCELLKHHEDLSDLLKEFDKRVAFARRKLRGTLTVSAFLLLGTMLIIAVPLEGVTYVGFTVITCLAVAVGLMFIHMIFEITEIAPVKKKLKIQQALANMSRKKYEKNRNVGK